jgi:hypothetical protein
VKASRKHLPVALAGAILASLVYSLASAQGDKQPGPAAQPSAEQLAAMMERAKRYTQPGEHHKLLERLVGEWNTETRLFLGGQATPAEKGTAQTGWLMEGRWLKTTSKGTMLGQPFEGFSVMGYDNFKMSYVVTSLTSMDTAMIRQEGDMDPGGKVLLAYGTLDEYTTGEHDKMVKTLWRFESADKIVMEIHDLPIGEKNTKVVEVVYTRKQ